MIPSVVAQGSLQRVTFSGGAVDNDRLTATVGQTFAGYATGSGGGSLSIGAQPGDDANGVAIDQPLDYGIAAYPNPTEGTVFVDIQDLRLTNWEIAVIDLQGRILLRTREQTISLDDYLAASYRLLVFDASNKMVKSFLIVKK